jgi:hypothetical protein
MRLQRCVLLLVVFLLMLPACQRPSRPDAGLPFANREILAEHVIWARDAQLAAADELQAILERYRAVTAAGGDPEAQYQALWHSNERSRDWAENVRSHIDSVEEVGRALFNQWDLELGHYQQARLRSASARYLGEVLSPYQRMLDAMRQAEARLQPVQAGFNDQLLFLKHGLDPQSPQLERLQADVANYLRAMEASVRESDAFLVRLKQP